MAGLALGSIGQIALATSDVDRAERFYGEALGLTKLFRFGDLTFFDCGGTRLMIEKSADPAMVARASTLYFRCDDIGRTVAEMKKRGVPFIDEPHLIAKMADHDLWMAFFRDPDGHMLARMHEAPKGYQPGKGAKES